MMSSSFGPVRVDVVEHPTEAADRVRDLDVGAAHRPGGIVAAEDTGQDRVERRVLGFLVRHEVLDEEAMDLAHHRRAPPRPGPSSASATAGCARCRAAAPRCSALNRRVECRALRRRGARLAGPSRRARSALRITATSMDLLQQRAPRGRQVADRGDAPWRRATCPMPGDDALHARCVASGGR